MLAVAISLVFATAAMLAISTIVLTIRGQWAKAMDLVAQSRTIRAERSFAVRCPDAGLRANVVTIVPRARYSARGPVTRKATGSLATGPLCAAA